MTQDNKPSLITGTDSKPRCWWCGDDPLYIKYHDEEWGRPVTDDTRLFEKICLEGFQAGLSWITILRKRENFRAAFDGFDYHKIAGYTKTNVQRLLGDAGIIRHRGKIEATVNNACRAIEMEKEFGSLANYFWSFEPELSLREGKAAEAIQGQQDKVPSRPASLTLRPKRLAMTRENMPSQTPESKALSKDLKKRGWRFVGPTTCYAFMQAMGMVNDHMKGCWVHNKELRGNSGL
jgi:DNA-3-methyladenine glycosylase I